MKSSPRVSMAMPNTSRTKSEVPFSSSNRAHLIQFLASGCTIVKRSKMFRARSNSAYRFSILMYADHAASSGSQLIQRSNTCRTLGI